jgi:hypothetical protein
MKKTPNNQAVKTQSSYLGDRRHMRHDYETALTPCITPNAFVSNRIAANPYLLYQTEKSNKQKHKPSLFRPSIRKSWLYDMY